MRLTSITALAAAALLSTAALAQAPAAPTASTPAKVAKPAKAPVVRTAKSLDCSKQADAQNAHGKARKAFMSKCKKA